MSYLLGLPQHLVGRSCSSGSTHTARTCIILRVKGKVARIVAYYLEVIVLLPTDSSVPSLVLLCVAIDTSEYGRKWIPQNRCY